MTDVDPSSPGHRHPGRGYDTLTAAPIDGWPTDQIAGAEVVVAHLATAARAWCLAQVTGLTGHCVCDRDDTCVLSERDGGRDACALAPALAALPSAGVPRLPRGPRETVGHAYLRAIEDATAAVYFCRRVRHPSGDCWFAPVGERDLCAEVLALSHRLAAH